MDEFAKKTVRNVGTAHEGVEYTHDCFGTIKISRSQGTPMPLFGSSMAHTTSINVEISRAMLVRRLNHDNIFDESGPDIVRFRMSAAQWAEAVSSIGLGSGVPITLEAAPERGTACKRMPGLKQDPVRKTFEEDLRKTLADMNTGILEAQKRIQDFAKPGAKPPTKDQLKELNDLLRQAGEHFRSNVGFAQSSFAETMENVVQAGKIEIQSHLAAVATRAGLDALAQGKAPVFLEAEDSEASEVNADATASD